MEKIRICAKCRYFAIRGQGLSFCEKTNLPTKYSGSCELYEQKEKEEKKKNYSKLLISIFIIVGVIFFFAYKYSERNERLKQNKKVAAIFLNVYSAQQASGIDFQEYKYIKDTLGHKMFEGIFYANKSKYQSQRFEKDHMKYHNELYSSNNQLDTIYLKDRLLVLVSDSIVVNEILFYGHLIKRFTGTEYVWTYKYVE